jgi:hypothetical protein
MGGHSVVFDFLYLPTLVFPNTRQHSVFMLSLVLLCVYVCFYCLNELNQFFPLL